MFRKYVIPVLLAFTIIIAPTFLFAKHNYYKLKIYTTDHKVIKCRQFEVTNESIIISTTKHKKTIFQTIPFTNITKILVSNKNNGANGFLIGAGTSLVTSAVIAVSIPDCYECDSGLKKLGVVLAGIFLAIPAGVLGTIIGNNTGKLFHINRDGNQFQDFKTKFELKYKGDY